MSKVRLLIVEDELLIATEMASMLQDNGYAVLEIVDNTKDARRALEMYELDVILVDINLKGEEDGISLANYISNKYAIPVIFITSLIDSKTVNRALQSKPSAFLVKPYNDHELRIAIEVAFFNFENKKVANTDDRIETQHSHYLLNQHFFIKENNRLERVKLEDVLWIKAEGSYVNIATAQKEYLLTTDTLGSIMKKMDCPWLMRVHRSFAVNFNEVEAIEGNNLHLNKKNIPIGKNYRSVIKRQFNIL